MTEQQNLPSKRANGHSNNALELRQPVRENSAIDDAIEKAHLLKASGFSKASVQANAVLILSGAEYGWPAFRSIANFHVIEGQPSLKASTLVAMCQMSSACEYFMKVGETHDEVTWETRRKGAPKAERSTYSMKDAQRARLANKGVWKSHPRDMMSARASSRLARSAYADVVGSMYTPDEQREIAGRYDVDHDASEPVEAIEVEAPASVCARVCPDVVFHLRDAFGSKTRDALLACLPHSEKSVEGVRAWLGAGKPVANAMPHHLLSGLNRIEAWFGGPAFDVLPSRPEPEPEQHTAQERTRAHKSAQERGWLMARPGIVQANAEPEPEPEPEQHITVTWASASTSEPVPNDAARQKLKSCNAKWSRMLPEDLNKEEASDRACAYLTRFGICTDAATAKRLIFGAMKQFGWVRGDPVTPAICAAASALDVAHALNIS